MSCENVEVVQHNLNLSISDNGSVVEIVESPVTEITVNGEASQIFVEEILSELSVQEENLILEISDVGLRGEKGDKGDPAVFSYNQNFVVADWVLMAGYYTLDVSHNLDSEQLVVEIWENSTERVEVNRVQVINQNTVRLHVSYDPDCRFDGLVSIISN